MAWLTTTLRRPACLMPLLLFAAACSRSPPVASTGESMAPGGTPLGRGPQLYQQNCVPCHREDARGTPGVYPALAGSAVATGDPLALARWVLSGVRPAGMPSGRYATQMLRFGWMKDADVAALLTFVRNSFGNQAPPVDEAAIARARAAE